MLQIELIKRMTNGGLGTSGILKFCQCNRTCLATRLSRCILFSCITQKRHPKPGTPYKSMSTGACARLGPQECLTYGPFHPLHGMACYDRGHLRAPCCHHPLARDARYLAKPPSPHPVLAGLHASPLPRAENLGELSRWTPAAL